MLLHCSSRLSFQTARSFLFLLFISGIQAIHTNASPHTNSNLQTQYIVTFTSYRPHATHELTLHSALTFSPPTSWHLLARNNHAALLPTDFVVIETVSRHVLSTLSSCPTVRRVSPQSVYPRSLSAIRLPTEVEEHDISTLSSPSSDSHHPKLHPFSAGQLWQQGFTGRGVAVAVFDTGLSSHDLHFPNVATRTDWTGENTTHDHVGHGTFVAGLIAGHHPSCPGLAPDVSLHIFRVFTASQVSYTSWFLDAFNYALHIGIDILNLSIGGPDFADNPFTEKIDELAAHGVIVVSAIGNDGPLWGSLNNPGDMMPVVGVGGVEPNGHVASFSSRGMTTHELDHAHQSYGRVKPDIVAYARSLVAPSHRSPDRCKKLSGTSVASPVVAGAIALLASTVPSSRRRRVVNPASVKLALVRSARRLPISSMYEQGAGLLDIVGASVEMDRIDSEFLRSDSESDVKLKFATRFLLSWKGSLKSQNNSSGKPFIQGGGFESSTRHKSFGELPQDGSTKTDDLSSHGREHLDNNTNSSTPSNVRRLLTSSEFPERSPTRTGPSAAFIPSYYDLRTAHCSHMWPHCAQPLFEGGMPVHLNCTILNPGGIEGFITSVVWVPAQNGAFLRVMVSPPRRFWPWSAGMGIHISATATPREPIDAEGVLKVRIVSVHEGTHSDIELPIMASVVLPPSRGKRLLWDMFHSIRYPPGYVPRDSLSETKDMLDWLGDHPHTNFHSFFRELIHAGFAIDILDQPLSCVGLERAKKYGGIMIFDSEDFFSRNDTDLLEDLVKIHGVALIVAAEWYSLDAMRSIRFEDDNTRSWWSPIIAGGNIPAVNALLERFGVAFGEEVLSGDVHPGTSVSFRFESGVPIVRFPPGGELLYVRGLSRFEGDPNTSEHGMSQSLSSILPKSMFSDDQLPDIPLFGLTKSGRGAVLAYGDTNCLDTAYTGSKCYKFFVEAVRHVISKCAVSNLCGRMLERSVIAVEGLWPSALETSVMRMAKPLSHSVLNVFRPHSKYTLRCADNSADDTCDVDIVIDVAETCSNRLSLQKEPFVDTFAGMYMEVVLPTYHKAEPVGSVTGYFSEDVLTWRPEWRSRVAMNLSNHDEVAHLFKLSFRGARCRSISLIAVGLCLMLASLSLRRMAHRGALWRKGNRVRTNKVIKSHTASPETSETGYEIIGPVGRSSSQSIGAILRSGRSSSSIYS